MNVGIRRIGGAHHRTRNVPAGGDGIEQLLMQPLDGRTNILLQHPVELEGLARRQPDGVAAMCPCQLVDLQPLLRRADPAGEAHADHERKGRLQLLPPPFVADVAIVLLVDAVELHELVAREGHPGGDPIEQIVRDVAAQIIAVVLQPLVGAELVQRLRQVGATVDVDHQ